MFYFTHPNISVVTEVSFFNMSIVLADIGGILSLITAIPLVFLVCLNKSFLDRMALDIQKKKRASVNSIEDQLIKQRFTYEGINDLFERVQAIEDQQPILEDKASPTS